MTHDTNNSTKRETDRQTIETTRRGILAGAVVAGTSGCLGVFGNESGSTDRGTYTTVPGTTTIPRRTGTRTPYSVVQPVQIGDGDLLVLFFDYGQKASLDWWHDTYPKLRGLIEDEKIRLQLAFHPGPVSRWSVEVPCAILMVKARGGNEAAVKFHRRVVDLAPEYSRSKLADAAETVGVDPAPVRDAMENRIRRRLAFASKGLAQKKGIDAVPAGYTGERVLEPPSASAIEEEYATEE